MRQTPLNLGGTLSGTLNGTLSGTLNDGQQKVFDFVVQHSGVQPKEIIAQLNIPLDTLNKHLNNMGTIWGQAPISSIHDFSWKEREKWIEQLAA